MTSPAPLVVLDRVGKRFAGHTAVDDLSLVVPAGVIYGLLGPNGAGKTTTLRMIMDILQPDVGTVQLFGEPAGGRRIDELSKGMQQKVQFISTVLHEPALVVLDEAFAGLDPVNAQVVKDTVLELCEQLCIIARGRKLVDGALSDIKRTRGGHHLVIGFDGSAGNATQVFSDKRLVSKIDNYGQYAEIELAPGADAQHILQQLVASGARLSRFELREPSLLQIFIDLVGPEAAGAEARSDA